MNTTPTAADANEERKAILAEVSLLKEDRDTARRECTQWISARDAVKAEMAAMLGLTALTKEHDTLLSTALLAKRDALRSEVEGLTAARESMEAEATKSTNYAWSKKEEISTLEAKVAELTAHTNHHLGAAKSARHEHLKAKEERDSEIGALEVKLAEKRAELERIRREGEDIESKNRDEDIRLATKSRDLAIYEARIREAAGKVDPPINIIL